MDLDDFLEPEVAIAVAVTAAIATPGMRKVLRKGAVYGLAGLLMAGDKISELAKSAADRAQHLVPQSGTDGAEGSETSPAAGEPVPGRTAPVTG
jgi:hypothetical protein